MNQAETFQIEPPERKSSGSGRLLLGLGIGCGIMALLCCGGAVGLGWWTARIVVNSVSTEPNEVRAATANIAQLDVPERFEPQATLQLDLPIVDDLGSMVVYENEADEETLILGDYRHLNVGNRPPSEVFRQTDADPLGKRVEVHQDDQDPSFEETSREQLERPMRGGTARFEIIQGKNTDTGEERIIAYGTFPGRRGTGVFMLSASAKNSSVEAVKQVIESLE
jgi:hypothetical protein